MKMGLTKKQKKNTYLRHRSKTTAHETLIFHILELKHLFRYLYVRTSGQGRISIEAA
jgi:hypothetical protein